MKLRILLILLLLALNARADKYLRSDATGANNGTDWTNAYNNVVAFEAALARGETGWVADGTYTGISFNQPVSGTTLITVKKATPSAHGTSTGWSDSMGDGQALFAGNVWFRSSYWVFDGVTGGGPGSWMTGFGFRVNASPTGPETVRVDSGADFITLRHTEVHGNGDGDDANAGDNDCFSQYTGSTDMVISYCYFVDAGRCPLAFADDNVLVEYSYTGKFESTTVDHAEAITFRRGSDTGTDPGPLNLIVRWSMFTWFEGTGGILFKGYGNYIYGNIFVRIPNTQTGSHPHGYHGVWSQKHASNIYAWNNTYIEPNPLPDADGSPFFNYAGGTGQGFTGTNRNILNGILFKDAIWTTFEYDNVTVHNYNHYAQITGTTVAGESQGSSSSSVPFVNYSAGNYGLTPAQAAAIPAGLTISGAPYNTLTGYNVDMFGNTRGADGKWDRGAIEYVESGSDVTAPTVFSATIDAEGDNLVVSFDEDVNLNDGGNMTIAATPGGAATLSSPSKTATAEITWNISRQILSSETVTRTYTTTANGIKDLSGNVLAAFSAQPVTNSSISGVVQTPVISLASGFYFGTQSVSISCGTSGATIRYTTDGTDPTSTTGTIFNPATPISITSQTTIRAKAFKTGLTDSALAAESYSVGTWTFSESQGQWVDFAVPQQTGTFTWTFRAMVPELGADSVLGLGPTAGFDHWDDTAVALRFKTTNVIDCINGAGGDGTGTIYQAVNVFPYVANATYEFAVVVNVIARTYSATVQQVLPTTGPVTIIATNYEFRNGHESTADLDNFGVLGLTSDTTVSSMSFGTDSTAPTPNPMTFASNPTALDSFSVTMTASTASDALNNPVSYFFEETTGAAGATDSGWQSGTTYTDTGLSPNTTYSYYVWARDTLLNQTSPSGTISVTTPAIPVQGQGAINCDTLNITTLRVGP